MPFNLPYYVNIFKNTAPTVTRTYTQPDDDSYQYGLKINEKEMYFFVHPREPAFKMIPCKAVPGPVAGEFAVAELARNWGKARLSWGTTGLRADDVAVRVSISPDIITVSIARGGIIGAVRRVHK